MLFPCMPKDTGLLQFSFLIGILSVLLLPVSWTWGQTWEQTAVAEIFTKEKTMGRISAKSVLDSLMNRLERADSLTVT